jgi:IS30 family transposase
MPARIKIDRAEFHRLNANGWTSEQLAEHFGVHPTSISRLRVKLGLSQKPTMTPERKQAIEAMLDDGMSYREINRTEGADMQTLRRHFPGRNWTPQQSADHLAAIRRATGVDWNQAGRARRAA